MEKESNNQLPFLDVLVTKKEDGTLGHQVYRKPTHTDRYLHKNSNHHQRQKMAVINTLMHLAERICETTHLKKELKHLELAFQANGFTRGEIRRALHPKRAQNNEQKSTPSEPLGKVFLPYLHRVTDRIGKLLEKHNIKTIFKPTTQLRNCYRPVKDPRGPFSTSGVYEISCSCESVYVETTKRSIKTRLSEHVRHCRLGNYDKYAVAEHSKQEGVHNIKFKDTEILATTYLTTTC
ncbi:uncharacterized protein LOC129219384 [Uloborus diversus]|uniref:uncharacterized protein LOC129219384 n=1 Tax=Uloborus diversus TaxID=327109 RepID=UPI0024097E03|nr:uncharacterized protein LOC129219384 [Uloborus diversus]